MIVFAHLFNNSSGSPRVLCSVINAVANNEDDSILFIGSGGIGCLDDVAVKTKKYWYRRGKYPIFTLFTYTISQLALFIKLVLCREIKSDAVIYVNAVLPFGAAIFGYITKRTVIYHIHEVTITPAPLKWFLLSIVKLTATHIIYVSDFHRECLSIKGPPSLTIHNGLDQAFATRAKLSVYSPKRAGVFKVLMIASLRDYKGLPQFVAVAASLCEHADIRFDLVVNAEVDELKRYFRDFAVPNNLFIHPRTDEPATYYEDASLVVNLSPPDQWVETFGLTILEGMAYGIPVIAPPIGGPLELFEEGIEGFFVDSRDAEALKDRVVRLKNDEALCTRLSRAGRLRAEQFTGHAFNQKLKQVLSLYETLEKT